MSIKPWSLSTVKQQELRSIAPSWDSGGVSAMLRESHSVIEGIRASAKSSISEP